MRAPTFPVTPRLAIGLLAVALALAAAPPVWSDDATAPPEAVASAPAPEVATAPAVSARVAFRDPATGRPTSTPTAEQRQRLMAAIAEAYSWSDEGLEEVELADGSIMVLLDGRFPSLALGYLDLGGEPAPPPAEPDPGLVPVAQ